MARVQESIEVEVSLESAYAQWSRVESFPDFMTGVESVVRLDERTSRWVINRGGLRREFDARIVEQVPNRLIRWVATNGKAMEGSVRFESVALLSVAAPTAADVAEETPGAGPGTPGARLVTDEDPGDDGSPEASVQESSGEKPPAPDAAPSPGGFRTRIAVDLLWEDSGLVEKAIAALGLDAAQIQYDLRRFRAYIESREATKPTGPVGS